jgi:holliday junction DNA helicase RuvA
MIARLYGKLHRVQDAMVLIDVMGVGYEVEVTAAVLTALPPVGQPLELCTHLVVREDASHLYGFVDINERELFRVLIRVSGVGPRMAMGLLSGIDLAEFARCLAENDVARLTLLPGVGRKTAERLVVELKDRIAPLYAARPRHESMTGARTGRVIAEAESALIALGYRPLEATRAVDGAYSVGISTEELVRRALRGMAASALSDE